MNKKNMMGIEGICMAIMLIMVVAIFCDANLFHYLNYIESDIGGDAILAKVIVESGMKVPDTWAGSTELRTVSASNLAAVFYLITANMNLSMGMACCLLLLLLVALMIIFYRKVGMMIPAAIAGALIPMVLSAYVHEALEMFAVYACYYSPHLIALFLNGIIFNAAKSKTGTKKVLYYAMILIIAFLIGTQGMRGNLMVFIPVAFVELCYFLAAGNFPKLKKADSLICSVLAVFVSFAASKISGAPSVGTTRNIRNGLSKLIGEVIPQMIELIDYSGFRIVLIIIFAILAIAGYVTASKKNKEVLYIPASLIIMLLAGAFTTTETTSRYFVVILFAIGTGCGLFLNWIATREKVELLSIPIVIGVVILAMDSEINYKNLLLVDSSNHADELSVIEFLKDNNYTMGHATFDYANMYTALSNGEITVSAIDNYENLKGTSWLSNAIWYPPYRDFNEVTFYICTDATVDTFKEYLETNNIGEPLDFYSCGKYSVYVLDEDYSYWRD